MTMSFVMDSHFFTTSDGVRLRYFRTGTKPKKPSLLFIHGAGGDATAWKEEQHLLWKQGYSSVALDFRGHGLSDDPTHVEAYAFERLAQDVAELIESLKLQKVVVIGHCFGGMVSLVLGAKRLPTITGLVLVDTSYRPSFFGKMSTLTPRLAKTLANLAYAFPQGVQKVRASYSVYKDTNDFDVRRFLADVSSTSLRSYLLCYSQLFSFDASALLASIAAPTLVVCGEADTIFPPSVSRQLAQRIKHADLKFIPEANHIIVISKPEALSGVIATFLKRLRA